MHRYFIFITILFASCNVAEKSSFQKRVLSSPLVRSTISDSLIEVTTAFEQQFIAAMNKKKFPGAAVVIIKDSSVVYMKGFGVKSTETNDSIDVNTVFRIGSLSKGFASILAGMQVQRGCFSWEEKVKTFVPSFTLKNKDQAERIAIKHILSHSTGLPRHAYTTLIEDGMSLEKIIPRLGKVKLIGKEGVYLSYQNAAYSIIEKVLEQDYQKPFTYLLEEQIFEPLAMKDAGCTVASLHNAENLALPHRKKGIKWRYKPLKTNRRFFNAIAAGGIHLSIHDMGSWLQLLLGNRPDLIDQKTLEEVFTPVVRLGNNRYFRKWDGVKESQYALGWRTFNYHGRKLIFHSGSVNNYRGEIVLDQQNKLAMAVLFNSTNSYASSAIPMFFELYEASQQNRESAEPNIMALNLN